MIATDKGFYVALGRRIAERRRSQNLTQVELAKSLSVSQQTIANYESGVARVPPARLLHLAKVLGTSTDALLGEKPPPGNGKRGPAPKFQQQLERLGRLPRTKQRVVSDMLDAYLKQAS